MRVQSQSYLEARASLKEAFDDLVRVHARLAEETETALAEATAPLNVEDISSVSSFIGNLADETPAGAPNHALDPRRVAELLGLEEA